VADKSVSMLALSLDSAQSSQILRNDLHDLNRSLPNSPMCGVPVATFQSSPWWSRATSSAHPAPPLHHLKINLRSNDHTVPISIVLSSGIIIYINYLYNTLNLKCPVSLITSISACCTTLSSHGCSVHFNNIDNDGYAFTFIDGETTHS
jgi:hypothetical protein